MLNQYFKLIDKFPPLPEKKERKLLKKAQRGDIKARNKIIEAYLKFVIYIAKRYHHPHIDWEDIISAGNLGLFTAIQKYNFKFCFNTYAAFWIKQAITRFIEDFRSPVRAPGYLQQLRRKLEKAGKKKVKVKYGRRLLNFLPKVASLNQKVGEEDTELWQMLEGEIPNTDSIDAKIILSLLTDRERNILWKRAQGFTLREISKMEGVSFERIRQIEKKAIETLRTKIAREGR